MAAVPVAPGGANDHHPPGIARSVDSGMDTEQSELPAEAEAHGRRVHNDSGDQVKSGQGKGKGTQTWPGNSSVMFGNFTFARHETTLSEGIVPHTSLCEFTSDHTIPHRCGSSHQVVGPRPSDWTWTHRIHWHRH